MSRGLLFLLAVGVAWFLAVPVAGEEEENEAHEIAFEPGEADHKLQPRFSPFGTRIPLEERTEHTLEGHDALEGRIHLGPSPHKEEGHLLVVARSTAGKPYDLLYFDLDGDGELDDEAPQKATPKPRRGGIGTGFKAELRVNYGSPDEPVWEPYPIALWLVLENEDTVPRFIRYSRRGYRRGQVTIDGVLHDVVLADGRNDAVYGEGDAWTIRLADDPEPFTVQRSREVGDFSWVGEQAWKLELEGEAGRKGRVFRFDPGITREEDERKRDPFWDDKHAERAEAPVPFEHDVAKAIEDAQAKGTPYFFDFETTWCTYCKYMDRWVFTAKDVVEAAQGILCIKVDGDEHKELVEKHEIGSYPSGVLLDAGGEVIATYKGYQTGKEMVDFFAKARPAPPEEGDR